MNDSCTPVFVSGDSLRQKFQPCSDEYVETVCLGRCCEGSKGILVTIHPTEESRITTLGGVVKDGLLQADEKTGKCPFKTDTGRCSIQGQDKPFGCKASPFTLTHKGTLIIRNRYRCLRCYNTENSEPAYIAHRWSLNQIFGVDEAERIVCLVASGEKQIRANMPTDHFQMLMDNDIAKHKKTKKNVVRKGFFNE